MHSFGMLKVSQETQVVSHLPKPIGSGCNRQGIIVLDVGGQPSLKLCNTRTALVLRHPFIEPTTPDPRFKRQEILPALFRKKQCITPPIQKVRSFPPHQTEQILRHPEHKRPEQRLCPFRPAHVQCIENWPLLRRGRARLFQPEYHYRPRLASIHLGEYRVERMLDILVEGDCLDLDTRHRLLKEPDQLANGCGTVADGDEKGEAAGALEATTQSLKGLGGGRFTR